MCSMSMPHRNNLSDLYARAFSLKREGRLDEAADVYADLVAVCPEWEHGLAYYNLACCYEELGRLHDAERCYLGALNYEPGNSNYLGGYASFLYQFGAPAKALTAYMSIIRVEPYKESVIANCMPALKELAHRLGMSEDELTQLISANCTTN